MFFEDTCLANPSEYLIQLLKDKTQLNSFSDTFVHVNRLLDEEINRVRMNVFNSGLVTEPLFLPESEGMIVTLTEKLHVPIKEFPEYNFVGRLLGPRGLTVKQLELDTGCRILIRGSGSMRDKQKEEHMKGKAKWEHLNEDLHVLVNVEDTMNRARIRIRRAVQEISKLLTPIPESEDDFKKRQLTELAVLNGTYRGFDRGILIAKSRGMDLFIPPPPTQFFFPSPGNHSQFLLGPIIQSHPLNPLTSPQPMTPLPSPGLPHHPLLFSPPPSDLNFLYHFDANHPNLAPYEYNPGPIIAPVH